MSLRAKISSVFLITLIIYVGIAYAILKLTIYSSFVYLEHEEARKDINRCVGAIRSEIRHLDILTNDWSAWNDMYKFASDGNKKFIESYFSYAVFKNSDVNMVYVIDTEGKVIYGEIYDFNSCKKIELSEFGKENFQKSHPLLAHKNINSSINGIFLTEQGPMLIASRPIITGTNQGPTRGTLLMGRFLDKTRIKDLLEKINVHFQVWSLKKQGIPEDQRYILNYIKSNDPYYFKETRNNYLLVYTTFPDYLGKTALLIGVDSPRNIIFRGTNAIYFTIILIVASNLLILSILLLSLQKIVLNPISKLTADSIAIGKNGDLSTDISLDRDDEIGILTKEFQRMLNQLSETRKKLLGQSYLSGMVETISDFLHHIRNTINPIIINIDILRQKLNKIPFDSITKTLGRLDLRNIKPEFKDGLINNSNLINKSFINISRDILKRLEDVSEKFMVIEEMLINQEKFIQNMKSVELLNPYDLVKESVDMISETYRRNIKFEIDPQIKMIGTLNVYKTTILQILSKVLMNAIESIQRKKMENGTIQIHLNVENHNSSDILHIQICDNGEDIDSSEIEHIFENEFFKESSLGKNLHWCGNTVSAMSGKIYAESLGAEQGTCVHLLIPKL